MGKKQQNMAHMQGREDYKLELCQSKPFLYIVKIKLVLLRLRCLKLLIVIPGPTINKITWDKKVNKKWN